MEIIAHLNFMLIPEVAVMPKRSIFYSKTIDRVLDNWPGKRFGLYRFLPAFFCLGAGMEFFMIHFWVGEVNFYKTYKKRLALDIIEKESGTN